MFATGHRSQLPGSPYWKRFRKMLALVLLSLLATSLADHSQEKRIVQGTPVSLYQHPHQASLQIQTANGWRHICGCVIVDTDKILTAAHCLDGQTVSKMRVVAGALVLYEAPNAYEQTVGVRSFVMHEAYNPNGAGIPNDIGVIRLLTPLVFNPNVQAADLAPKGSSFANTKCVITGWGQTSGSGPASIHLLEAKITKITTSECQRRWLFQTITNKHICVYESSAPSGSRPSACMGDSGGPMMCGNNLQLLAGLTSWGVSNCSGNYPSVYTRVSEYLDWIASK